MPPTEWPPKFRPHDRVIDHLIGPQLYTSADAAVRELLQNAEDACTLQSVRDKDDGYEARITVRFSREDNWCEFEDNGLGMNQEAVRNGLAWVGAPKTEVTHLRELIEQAGPSKRQIAQFGIGILSCFGVAQSVELHTKMDGAEAIGLEIADYHEQFVEITPRLPSRGTIIRLTLKPGGPMSASDVPDSVRRYARHAGHVTLHGADAGTDEPLQDTWLAIPDGLPRKDLSDETIRQGFIALDTAWFDAGAAFGTQLVTCNGGFAVNDKDIDLLPAGATGFCGELDVVPGTLTILMNREGFKRDEKWQRAQTTLLQYYRELLYLLLEQYETGVHRGLRLDAIERGVMMLTKGPVRSLLEVPATERADRLVSSRLTIDLWDSQKRMTPDEIFAATGQGGTAYYIKDEQVQSSRQHSVADADSGSSIQITEMVSTISMRAAQLRAGGKVVVSCKRRTVGYTTAAGAQNLTWHEFDVLSECAQRRGITLTSVADAPADAVALAPLPESALVNDVLDAGNGLKIVYLPGSSARVIPDYTGRLLNAAHPDVDALLTVIPAAAGNPVLRVLVQAYIDLDNWEFTRAKERIRNLLAAPDLAERAQLQTGRLLREYLERTVEQIRRRRDTQ